MSRGHKERQKKFYERNGILGELNLEMTDVFLLAMILDRLCYEHNVQMIHATIYEGIVGQRPVDIEDISKVADKFIRLARHLRMQERIRLGFEKPKEEEENVAKS